MKNEFLYQLRNDSIPPLHHKKEVSSMTLEQALYYIHSVCWKGTVPGLSRTQELLAKMGNPEKKLKFVHIAGTNGKGSTCAMLASVLGKAGYRVGLYTSPFIVRFNERMQINGENISNDELVKLTEYIKPIADSMEDKPTEFELITALAFEYFYQKGGDSSCVYVCRFKKGKSFLDWREVSGGEEINIVVFVNGNYDFPSLKMLYKKEFRTFSLKHLLKTLDIL